MINEICYDELKNMFNREIGDINLPEIKLENGYLGSRLECEVMAKLCKLQKPKKIFEIGTFEGGTTLIMAMNSPEAEIYTLDLPWINQPDRKEEIGNSNQFYIDNRKKIVFEDTHYAKRITRLFGDSSDFPIRGHAHSIDFVFVDGCHTEHYIKNDTDKAFEMVSSGGIIVWHDYDPTEHSCWDCVFNHLNEISSLGIHHITGTAIAFYRKDK